MKIDVNNLGFHSAITTNRLIAKVDSLEDSRFAAESHDTRDTAMQIRGFRKTPGSTTPTLMAPLFSDVASFN